MTDGDDERKMMANVNLTYLSIPDEGYSKTRRAY